MKNWDSLFGIKNFRLVESGIDTTPFLAELERNKGLWQAMKNFAPNELEGKKSLLHQHSLHIYLRSYARTEKTKDIFYGDIVKTAKNKAYARLPMITSWAEAFARRHNGEIGRMYISNLQPHTKIYRHWDRGLYYILRDRYHVVFQSDGGIFTSGSQWARLKQGNVYWFNNKLPHEAINESDQGRIHLIFDLLPHSLFKKSANLLLTIRVFIMRKLDLLDSGPAEVFIDFG